MFRYGEHYCKFLSTSQFLLNHTVLSRGGGLDARAFAMLTREAASSLASIHCRIPGYSAEMVLLRHLI